MCGDSGKGDKTVSYNIKSAIKTKTFLKTLMFQRVQASAHANVTWWKRKSWKLKSGLIKFWRQRSPSPTLCKGSAFTFCKTWLHIHSAFCKSPVCKCAGQIVTLRTITSFYSCQWSDIKKIVMNLFQILNMVFILNRMKFSKFSHEHVPGCCIIMSFMVAQQT